MKAEKNIAYVGTLQELGRPYSMLFVNKENRQLYIFIRISDGNNSRFLVAGVSPNEVESYMNENLGLLNIIGKKTYCFATISDNKIFIDDERFSTFIPTDRIKKMNIFDPELCYDDVWLEIFLNRINNNQPIEV